mmetsp:Transcript_37989/g.46420  ORF Transcript_37989/g.46420 Transcript_37989/m.46420 type:complete len:91 (+) Transcript_37989:1-273(+)
MAGFSCVLMPNTSSRTDTRQHSCDHKDNVSSRYEFLVDTIVTGVLDTNERRDWRALEVHTLIRTEGQTIIEDEELQCVSIDSPPHGNLCI